MAKPKGKEQVAEAEAPHVKRSPYDFQMVMERVVRVARPYARPIGIGVAALVLVIVAASIWSGIQAKKEGKATAELGKVLSTATARVEEGGVDIEALTAGREPEPAQFKTFKDRSEAELAAGQALDQSFAGSKVSERAKLVEAAALYDLGKYDEAIAADRAFLASGPSPELQRVAREGIGYSLEAKALAQTDAAARNAGLDEALKAYTEIATDDKDPGYATALYHQARIQALKGQKAAAVELYKKVLEKNPGPGITELVQGRLALLDPNPAPNPAPAAPPAPPK